jgi:mRNA-degrading endonuclease RelE of RelBE toxin-antitoxin system
MLQDIVVGLIFDKDVERFVVKKKFRKLPAQIREVAEAFSRGELDGALLSHRTSPIAYDVYKTRLPNKDTNTGKSNGYRLIYIVKTEDKIVVLLTIYYKKEIENMSDHDVDMLIKGYFLRDAPETDTTE